MGGLVHTHKLGLVASDSKAVVVALARTQGTARRFINSLIISGNPR